MLKPHIDLYVDRSSGLSFIIIIKINYYLNIILI